MERKLISKRDLIVLIIIIVLAVGLMLLSHFGGKDDNLTAVITVDGVTQRTLSLSEVTSEETITLDNSVVIRAQDKSICFYDSDCPDKVCMHTGWISHDGDVAACVPNKTVIHIVGSAGDVDVITY